MPIVTSTIIGFVSSSTFASIVAFPVRIMSSVVGIRICVITAGITKVYVNHKEKKVKPW